MNNKKRKSLTLLAATTFKCVECGAKYKITHVSVKMSDTAPKYCKYCMR